MKKLRLGIHISPWPSDLIVWVVFFSCRHFLTTGPMGKVQKPVWWNWWCCQRNELIRIYELELDLFFSRLKFWMGWYDLLNTVVKWDITMSVLEFIDRQFILKSSLDKLLHSYLNFGWKVFFSQTHLNYKQKITYCSCIFYIIVTVTI